MSANPETPSDQATPTITIDEVVAGFADLPTLAPVAVQVIRLADDENASMADLAAAISVDPGLTARLMRLANSAMYGQTKEVTNLDRATALLGLRTVKLLSLGFSLVTTLDDGPIDTSIIWRRSLATSVLARRLATVEDRRLADDAFVVGLLSNIGKLALAEQPAYATVVSEQGPWMTAETEQRCLGFTSDEVSALILASWGLPGLISDVVRGRSNPPDDTLESRPDAKLAGILHVADAAAQLLLDEDDAGKAGAIERIGEAASAHLTLTGEEVEALIDEASSELDEIAAMFDLEAIATTPVTDIILAAKAKMAELSLDMVTALSEEQQRTKTLQSDNERLAAEASTDPLTGMANRRTFDAYLTNQIEGRVRKPRSSALGVIMIDIDHFKSVNDSYGHAVGDDVLKVVGNRIRAATRRGELSARVGGEEFAIVLPDVSGPEINQAGERFRALMADEPIDTAIGPLAVTASIGASYVYDVDHDAASAIMAAADAALYESKNTGRNRVTCWPMKDGVPQRTAGPR
jgi:diguanylate cyclase (GGDEF)-like protein